MYDYDDNNKYDSIQENWEYVFSDIQRLLRGKGFPLFLHASGDLTVMLWQLFSVAFQCYLAS